MYLIYLQPRLINRPLPIRCDIACQTCQGSIGQQPNASGSVERVVRVGLVEHLLAVVAAVAVGVRFVRVGAVNVRLVVVEQAVLVGVNTPLLLAAACAAGIVGNGSRMRGAVQRLGARV